MNNFSDSLLGSAKFSPLSLQAPDAWCGHLPFAAWLIRNIEPKIFVELGTHSGNSYFSFCQSVSEARLVTKCYAVDTWQGDEHAGTYGEEVFHQVHTHNQAHYASFSRLLRMTFDEALDYFSDGSIELLHIDGLHTYEAVKHDFESWLPKLGPGAVVLFHDTNVRERGFGVWKLWEELQTRFPNNLEFLHSHGLGVLQLDNAQDTKKLLWLDSNYTEQQQLKDYFSELGIRQLERFELAQLKNHLSNLNRVIAEHDGQIATLNHIVGERDGQIATLNHIVGERDGQIAALKQVMVERDNEIATLKRVMVERDDEIVALNHVIVEREVEIASLKQTVTNCGEEITKLGHTIAERDRQIACLNHRRHNSIFYRFKRRAARFYWQWLLSKSPLFNPQWYLSHYPDVAQKGVNPLKHYLANGWKEGRRPGLEFDGVYYLSKYPDLKGLDIPPLVHYWLYGRFEGRHINSALDLEWQNSGKQIESRPIAAHASCMVGNDTDQDKILISVIIPTYNRINLLPGIIDSWRKVHEHTKYQYEIIFSDDGSEDGSVDFLDTVADLPLRVLRNPHGGASSARNAAIRVAKGERALIIGDDIFPDPEIINVHAELGKRLGPMVATLGTVNWHEKLHVNHLMFHITEIGNEQFSYNCLINDSFVDFRHFYTCNICVPRKLILEQPVIFDEHFVEYGFEDIELGYRLSLRGMKIYFTTAATGAHYHPYTIDNFCRRQRCAGRMAVVFAEKHFAVREVIGVKKYFRKVSGKDSFWQTRIELLVGRCDEYEKLIAALPLPISMGMRESLSAVYCHLFRAMYEYGILEKIGKCPNPLTVAMTSQFAGLDKGYWDMIKKNTVSQINITVDEIYNLGEALNSGNSSDLLYGPEQRAVFEELIQLRALGVSEGRTSKAITRSPRSISRSFYHYFKNPRYLGHRLKQVVTQMHGQRTPDRIITESKFRLLPAIPGLIIDIDNIDEDIMIIGFRSLFGPEAKVYRRVDNDMLIPLLTDGSGANPVDISAVDATIFFWPASAQALGFPNRLLSAYMALVENGLSLVLISHSLTTGSIASVGLLRDHLVFSRDIAHAIFKGTIKELPLVGKVLRLLPAWGSESEQSIDNIFGCSMGIDDNGFFKNSTKEVTISTKYTSPYLPRWIKSRPIVFVFPIFLAVGGVERNTIEIMRKLNDHFDFIVITMERLRPEQGSLANQAMEVAARVIEMSEIVNHVDYMRVLSRLKTNFNPNLVWVCNGSPWFCDNTAAIRKIFYDVPIIDQEVYDVEQGWISRYADPGIQSFDHFIAVNKKIEERFLRDFRIDPTRVHLIYSAVDTIRIRDFKALPPKSDELRKKFGLPDNKKLFTFVARLTPQKRPIEFLKLAQQRLKFDDEFFVLVGDGELASQAQDFIERNKLTNVKRIPYIENTLELNAISSGILFTSAYEGLPIAMLEAISMGVPCFATDVGDISDVLSEYHGGIAVPIDLQTDAFSRAFSEWLEHREEYVESLKAREFDILERFSSENIAKQYLACWQKAMAYYEKKIAA